MQKLSQQKIIFLSLFFYFIFMIGTKFLLYFFISSYQENFSLKTSFKKNLKGRWHLCVKGDLTIKSICLKVHKNENFFGFDNEFILFHCYLCINNKILEKFFFDWTIMGGATIIPRSFNTMRNGKNFKIGHFFHFLNHI